MTLLGKINPTLFKSTNTFVVFPWLKIKHTLCLYIYIYAFMFRSTGVQLVYLKWQCLFMRLRSCNHIWFKQLIQIYFYTNYRKSVNGTLLCFGQVFVFFVSPNCKGCVLLWKSEILPLNDRSKQNLM